MIAGLNRVNHHLEIGLLVGEQRADQQREKEENQKGDAFLLPEHELEMISSLDGSDQKMLVHLDGLLPEEDPGLPFDEDPGLPFDVAGLQEGEVDLPGGEIGVDAVDLVWEDDPDHEVAVDGGAGAK